MDSDSELSELPDSELSDAGSKNKPDETSTTIPDVTPPTSADTLTSTGTASRSSRAKKVRKRKAKSVSRSAEDTEAPHSDTSSTKPKDKKRRKRSKASSSDTKKEEANNGDGRLKKKRKQRIVDPDSDSEHEPEPRKKKGIVAKEAVWKDIPDWGDRKDCPLMKLPSELLDMCFGLQRDLGVRDYVALAGVSRFFRHYLTPDVFHEICSANNVKTSVRFGRLVEAVKIRKGHHIFSRKVKEWHKEPEPQYRKYGEPNHYIPDAPRRHWSREQYIVYKEEQAKWRKREEALATKEYLDSINQNYNHHRHGTVYMKGQNRTVLAMVDGRRDGEPPIARDEKGLPLSEHVDTKTEDSSQEVVAQTSSTKSKIMKRNKNSRKSGSIEKSRWKIPTSDSESEFELIIPKLEPEIAKTLIHDYWPNKWRIMAAEQVNQTRMNKSSALLEYKVTDAQLLSLRHVLVPNPMNSKSPQQIFISAAVEALALRAHGGTAGHELHMLRARERAAANVKARAAKKAKAKADGTYVRKPAKHNFYPFEVWEKEMYGDFCSPHCACGMWWNLVSDNSDCDCSECYDAGYGSW